MRELNLQEVSEVSGGIYQLVAGYLFGKAVDAAIDSIIEYSEQNHGQTTDYTPAPGEGFGTI